MSSEVNVIKDYQPDYLNGKVSSICDFLPIPDPVLKVKLVPDSLCKLERVAWMVHANLEWISHLAGFTYHLHKLWTNRFLMVNNHGDLRVFCLCQLLTPRKTREKRLTSPPQPHTVKVYKPYIAFKWLKFSTCLITALQCPPLHGDGPVPPLSAYKPCIHVTDLNSSRVLLQHYSPHPHTVRVLYHPSRVLEEAATKACGRWVT